MKKDMNLWADVVELNQYVNGLKFTDKKWQVRGFLTETWIFKGGGGEHILDEMGKLFTFILQSYSEIWKSEFGPDCNSVVFCILEVPT